VTQKNHQINGLYPDLVFVDPVSGQVDKCIEIAMSNDLNAKHLADKWKPLLQASKELVVCVPIEDVAKAKTLVASLGTSVFVWCYETDGTRHKLATCP